MLQFLIGPSLHPGGLTLTRKLARKIGLSSADRVLDVSSGLGETARFLTEEYGCRVYGIDLSRKLTKEAAEAHQGAGGFLNGDAERLPFRRDSFTAAISECSLCLLPGFNEGLKEILQVLSPSGRLGITDIVTLGPLNPELEDVLMSFLCVAHKVTRPRYLGLVGETGFTEVEAFEETDSLRVMLEGIKKRLLLAELLSGIGKLSLPSDQLLRGKRLLALAQEAVEEGSLAYFMLTARKP
jgi:ubiquinone/menaquinone biosynthesis C-methylase UbiE